MHKNVVGNDEYETRATNMTTTPGGGEVVEFYGRPRRDTRKGDVCVLSVWMMTITRWFLWESRRLYLPKSSRVIASS